MNELNVSHWRLAVTVLTAYTLADSIIDDDEYNDAPGPQARNVHHDPSLLSSHQEDLAALARRLKKRYSRRAPSPFNGVQSSDSSVLSSERPGSQLWVVQIPVSLLGYFHMSCRFDIMY
jgi:hypothetical protein